MEDCVSAYMDATCTEDPVSGFTDNSSCTEDRVSVCMDVSDENTDLHRSTCPSISTKGTGMHVFMSKSETKVKTFICGSTDAYDNYGKYELIRGIGEDVVNKVQKGISYADALQQYL